jgi:hypothetical protein
MPYARAASKQVIELIALDERGAVSPPEGQARAPSTLITMAARLAVAALNAAAPQRNVDRPKSECLRPTEPPQPDLVLLARSASDSATVQLWFSGCTGRRLHNGRSDAQITQSLLEELMKPLHRGFSSSPLPP